MSPPYHLHPEFGLLCPSRRFRRKARVAFAFVAFSVIVGALAPKLGHDPDSDGASITAHGDVARINADTVQTVGQAMAFTTAESSAPLERGEAACGRERPNYIDVKCSVVRARNSRSPRAANEAAMIAALPLGRRALLAPASSAASLDPADAATTGASTPAVADLREPPAPRAPKSVRKPSRRIAGHGVSRDLRWRDNQWSARAYALPDNRYLGNGYERSWRSSW